MGKQVILTGLRANNDLHLGNYLGALLPMVEMQKKYGDTHQIHLFVPDLHSFTTPIDHSKLYAQSMHNLRLYVAAGLSLENDSTYLYRQSYIPAHSEMTIILNCFTYMGELKRMTQFKEKSEQQDNVSVGLFDYPVLMAADILLYGATYVPVGDDQTQHVELARDIGQRINRHFDQELFALPAPEKEQVAFMNQQKRLRIRDLVNPTKKMSKSDASGRGVIFLGDTPEVAAQKVMSAATDSLANVQFNMDTQPGISNLLLILSALSGKNIEDTTSQYNGQTQYKQLKQDTAEAVKLFLASFQKSLDNINQDNITDKLRSSETTMNQLANTTLCRVQQAAGLRAN